MGNLKNTYFYVTPRVAAPELKTLKYQIFFKKTLGISIVSGKCGHEYRKEKNK